MNVQILTDEKILDMLRKDSQKGIVLLMEKYTGLVWHVISFHVENPEDIKECINDTFTKFYFQRKKFDPKKASLPVYLTAIARKLAISHYRRERVRRAEMLNENFEQEDRRLAGTELRVDMERALAVLKPNELQIIRMKYYDGMTVREIANSLDLPYETVKKRHQRSVLKLSQSILLLILLMASITICAYGVLRYFDVIPPIWPREEEEDEEEDVIPDDGIHISSDNGYPRPDITKEPEREPAAEELLAESQDGARAEFSTGSEETDYEQTASVIENYTVSPGYGINMNPQEQVYSLAEKVVYETDSYTISLEEAVYINNKVVVTFIVRLKELLMVDEEAGDVLKDIGSYMLGFGENSWEYDEAIHYKLDQSADLMKISFTNIELPASDQGLQALTLRMKGDIGLVFDLNPEKQEALTSYSYQLGEYGGVLAVPGMEEGSLIVAIYPLDDDDEFQMIPALIRDSYGELTGDNITVTSEDGTVFAGKCMGYSPHNLQTYYKWDFGEVPPGNYTLHVPAIYYEYQREQELFIPLNLEENTWEELYHKVPKGSIYLKECVSLEMDPDIKAAIDDNYMSEEEGLAMWEETKGRKMYWGLTFAYNAEDPVFSVAGFYGIDCEIERSSATRLEDGSLGSHFSMKHNNLENGTVDCTLDVDMKALDTMNIKHATIVLKEGGFVNYRWNSNFHILFTVD